MDRRFFLQVLGCGCLSLGMSSCATVPITERKQLKLIPESKLIPEEINPNSYLPFSIPGLEIALSIIFITLIGFISLSFIGKRILKLINDMKVYNLDKKNTFVGVKDIIQSDAR